MGKAGTLFLEGYARVQGYLDYRSKREHHIWQAVASTKDLEAGQRKVRRICNAQSVIVFRFIIEGAKHNDINREREEHEATEAARKLLLNVSRQQLSRQRSGLELVDVKSRLQLHIVLLHLLPKHPMAI